MTRKDDRITIRDADDLYANIPVYAAKFEAKLQKSGELNVAMTMVGRYSADRSSVRVDELQGDCSRATHFVTALTVGAFEFFAGADAEIGGGVAVMNAGAGAHGTAKRETLNRDGDKAACENATDEDKRPPAQCGALIRVEVVPLGEAKALAATCPDGTQWDGSQCVGKKLRVDCPPGSTWDGSKCVASVDTNCASGMHFESGRGCVANVQAPPPTSTVGSGEAQAERCLAQYREDCALYKKACDGNDAEGCYRLGMMYQRDHGVTKNAIALWQKACDLGLAHSCGLLGLHYENGRAVPANRTRAIGLYRQACKPGYDWGCTQLKRLGESP
jgi:hypothetical protein